MPISLRWISSSVFVLMDLLYDASVDHKLLYHCHCVLRLAERPTPHASVTVHHNVYMHGRGTRLR